MTRQLMKEDKLERYDFEYPFSKCEISLQQRKSNLNTWYTALLRNTSCIFPHTLPFTLQANVVVFCLILLGFWLSKSIVFFFKSINSNHCSTYIFSMKGGVQMMNYMRWRWVIWRFGFCLNDKMVGTRDN